MLDPERTKKARNEAARVSALERDLDRARADFHFALRDLHLHGATMREIAGAFGLSHQRVSQIVRATSASWMDRIRDLTRSETRLCCSFCGRSSAMVERLVGGPGVMICDGCIAAAAESYAGRASSLSVVGAPKRRCSFCAKAGEPGRRLSGTADVAVCEPCQAMALRFCEQST